MGILVGFILQVMRQQPACAELTLRPAWFSQASASHGWAARATAHSQWAGLALYCTRSGACWRWWRVAPAAPRHSNGLRALLLPGLSLAGRSCAFLPSSCVTHQLTGRRRLPRHSCVRRGGPFCNSVGRDGGQAVIDGRIKDPKNVKRWTCPRLFLANLSMSMGPEAPINVRAFRVPAPHRTATRLAAALRMCLPYSPPCCRLQAVFLFLQPVSAAS